MDDVGLMLHEAEDRIESWLCELDQSCIALRAEAQTEAKEILAGAWNEAHQVLELAREEAVTEAARVVASADDEAAAIVAAAQAEARRVLQDAHTRARSEAAQVVAAAADQLPVIRARATATANGLLAEARAECAAILAAAGELADQRRREAEEEFDRLRMIAAEHADAVRALAAADAAAARGAVRGDLSGIRDAVARLRGELSRVVDAAFDALPAVEATAGALDRVWDGESYGGAADAHDLDDLDDFDFDDDFVDLREHGEGLNGVSVDLTVDEPVLVGAAPRRGGRIRRLLRLG